MTVSVHLDLPRIRFAIHELEHCEPDARLLMLKNFCVNNGIWAIPETPTTRHPVLFEVQLFGVPAMATDHGSLAKNWIKAARNILQALPNEATA